MKKLMLSASVLAAAVLALTAKTNASDPVVMTVDNRDVHLSEFEYLYNKNIDQGLTPLSFDEYVDMFVNYKLKVADALNMRLDTMPDFQAEYDKVRRDLAQPFLPDQETSERLVQEAYDHTADEVYVSHIMLPLQDPQGEHKMDSIRQLIVSGQITFEDAARENSIDRHSGSRGGKMGWVSAGYFPWPFEVASYNTPVGEISEVVNSGQGYHLVRPEERRKSRGEVLVQHILILTQGLDEDQKVAAKAKIDSIYRVVNIPGCDFSDVARRLSEDPGSAPNGGKLDWFGAGQMVAEFDSVSYALPIDGISEPFTTSYGYHIVHKLDQRGPKSLDEMRPEIENAISKDPMRARLAVKATIDKAAAATGSSIADYNAALLALIGNDEEVTEEMIARVKACEEPAYTAVGKTVTIGETVSKAPLREGVPTYLLIETVKRWVDNGYNNAMLGYIMDQLEKTEPSYRNLLNEYRDGILLYNRSNQVVWDYGAKDTEGLKRYFDANRDKYATWTEPHYKSYVIFAPNDSTLNEIMQYANEKFGGKPITEIGQEEFTNAIKERFPRTAKVERVIAKKGDNPYTDLLGFGGPAPENHSQTWKVYAAFAPAIIDQPEEVSDVRSTVLNDYQSQLEQDWVKQLRQQYKVKLNKKALKKAQKQENK